MKIFDWFEDEGVDYVRHVVPIIRTCTSTILNCGGGGGIGGSGDTNENGSTKNIMIMKTNIDLVTVVHYMPMCTFGLPANLSWIEVKNGVMNDSARIILNGTSTQL